MPSGGASCPFRPCSDPNALRRVRDEGEWTTLPAEGGLSRVPDWPLTGECEREARLWRDLWLGKPQAHMWQRLGLELEVALYVRRFSEAELPGAITNLSTLVRQMGDSLGLTTPGMRANRWKISPSETAKPVTPARRASQSARDRLRVIPQATNE